MEELLITYGPLGLWTAALLFEKYKHLNKITSVIEANTVVMTQIMETMKKCQKK